MRASYVKSVWAGLGVSAAVLASVLGGHNWSTNAVAADAPAIAAPPPANLPAAPPLEAKEKDAPGVAVTFYPAGSEGKAEAGDTRASRMIALHVPAGQPASPFIPAGKFTAVFEGDVVMRLRDTYTFSAEGRGKVTVSIGDKAVLTAEGEDFSKAPAGEPIRLSKGKNKITVKYESPAAGDASLRLLWTVKGEYYSHSVPPTQLSHNAGGEAVAKGMRLREGRQLLADLRCVKCHVGPVTTDAKPLPVDPAAASKLAIMPELMADAPNLSDVGKRLNKDWLTAWINNPAAFRPTPHMPRVFKPEGGDADAIDPRAADVAAYLATLGAGSAKEAFTPTEEQITRGGQLFTHLNCAACHEPPAGAGDAPPVEAVEGETPAPARIPLKFVKAKFEPRALSAFLLKPSAHYAWIPMPNFHFTPADADAVAAFLLSQAAGALPENLPAGDAAKGKLLLASSGCINCHAAGEEKSTLKTLALNDLAKDAWTRGCLAPDDAGHKTAPHYNLNDAQRQAIVAFAATDRASLAKESPAEFSMRQIVTLNCNGCHARDGKESLLATIYDAEHKSLEQTYPAPKGEHAESFAPDQRAPLMTWFGEKMRPQWSAAFIAGQVPYKPRPYLHARMPAFEARAGLLAAGMAAEHGFAPIAPDHPRPDKEMADVGSKLAGKTPNESFSCVQCHAVNKQPALNPFEAPAVNFAYVSERLQKDYYHRWVHNPLRLDPTTKMPAFERDDGKTTITAFYDADARKQFEALWQYILEGKEIKPPTE